MRTAARAFFVGLVGLVPNTSFLLAAGISSGSGVVIGTHGEVLTNSHVVEDCQTIRVQFSSTNSETAVLVAQDKRNDLAVIKTENVHEPMAEFRDGPAVRAGDTVVALGYPLSGLLATTANLSVGNVSALAGLADDSRYVQISTPVCTISNASKRNLNA